MIFCNLTFEISQERTPVDISDIRNEESENVFPTSKHEYPRYYVYTFSLNNKIIQ